MPSRKPSQYAAKTSNSTRPSAVTSASPIRQKLRRKTDANALRGQIFHTANAVFPPMPHIEILPETAILIGDAFHIFRHDREPESELRSEASRAASSFLRVDFVSRGKDPKQTLSCQSIESWFRSSQPLDFRCARYGIHLIAPPSP